MWNGDSIDESRDMSVLKASTAFVVMVAKGLSLSVKSRDRYKANFVSFVMPCTEPASKI